MFCYAANTHEAAGHERSVGRKTRLECFLFLECSRASQWNRVRARSRCFFFFCYNKEPITFQTSESGVSVHLFTDKSG